VLPEVVWMSQAFAEVYEPGECEVCVSIRDHAAPLPGLSPSFIAVLSLEFEDDPEPGWEQRGRSITEAQADQVIEFVERHVGPVGSSSTAGRRLTLAEHRRWTAGRPRAVGRARPDRQYRGVSTHPGRLRSPARGAASLVSPRRPAVVTM
jgi:hypothetical protein